MAIVRVIEVLSQSDKSWEDAAQQAVMEAKKTLRGIQSIYIKEFQAIVNEQQEIALYRINAKISFLVEEER